MVLLTDGHQGSVLNTSCTGAHDAHLKSVGQDTEQFEAWIKQGGAQAPKVRLAQFENEGRGFAAVEDMMVSTVRPPAHVAVPAV